MRYLVFIFSFVNACGALSAPSYIPFGSSSIRQCSLMDATKEEFKVCLTGRMGPADLERAKAWSTESLLAWFKVFKKVDKNVTSKIVYTCDGPHLTWNGLSGSGRSYAGPRRVNIYMSVGYGTWTHELGHALVGLGDTYTGSRAGACRRGQPASLMCWGQYGPKGDRTKYSTLWEDDVNGAMYTYKVAHGETTPPEFADQIELYGPVDVNAPWPELEVEYRDFGIEVDYSIPETSIDLSLGEQL